MDKIWNEVVEFIRTNGSTKDFVFAPSNGFEQVLDNPIVPDDRILTLDDLKRVRWFVIHKGKLAQINLWVLNTVITQLKPVFANDVFVVFAKKSKFNFKFKKLRADNIHFKALLEGLKNIATGYGNDRMYEHTHKDRMAVDVGNNTVLANVLDYKMYIHAGDLTLAPHLILDGYWEMWNTNVFKKLVKDGMLVFDIGANFGYYTLIAADKVGDSSKVYAFEPDPSNFDFLTRNIEINGFEKRAEALQVAVMNKEESMKLFRYEKHQGNCNLFYPQSGENMSIEEVRTLSIDDFVREYNVPKVDRIKIDAEGAEPYIFKGMKRTIEENNNLKIISEFAPLQITAAGYEPRKFLEDVMSYGFKLKYIHEHTSEIRPIDFDTCLKTELTTLFLEF